jgi:hypothetical protein
VKPITKPDVTNTSPGYWEKVLKSYGLGAVESRHFTEETEDVLDLEPDLDEELSEEVYLNDEESEE